MRLLAKVYADGPTPSKVLSLDSRCFSGLIGPSVVAELHET